MNQLKRSGKYPLTILLIAAILLSSVITAAADTAPAIFGDVDGDHFITILDATAIQRRLADFETYCFNEETADTDGDGDVTILDATAIQRYLAELPAHERIGKMTEEWIAPNEAEACSFLYSQHMFIQEIYPDFFIATPIFPLPDVLKINGSISEHWCVGDQVYCVVDVVRYGVDTSRYEGDLVSIEESTFSPDPNIAYKPVIYLYPEEACEVSVSLDLDGELMISAPVYQDGWTVKASPDGTLTDADGKQYDYLFWEAKLNADYDLSKGFCVRGEDTGAFLNDALEKLGLTRHEADDFIDFWLPVMEKNPYNVISFQTDAYTDAAGLNISPQPDTVIRVFMTYYAADSAVDLPAQELTAPERSGFTAVEWGGSMVR